MSLVNISIDTTGLEQMGQRLGKIDLKPAIARALNRTGSHMLTIVTRQLAGQSGLGVREVRDEVHVTKAYAGKLSYRATIPGRWLTLAHFEPTQTRRGVSARPWGFRRTFPHAFLVRSVPFIRETRERLPVRPLFGPSLAREFERGDVERMAREAAAEAWQKNIKHEVDFALRGVDVGTVSAADGDEGEEAEAAIAAVSEMVEVFRSLL
jgi:Prophage minor tail protein Z (GPZ)